MLKTRVMPTLLFKDHGLVKGVSFDSWRRVGTVMQAVKVYNMRQVDELVFLDITATTIGREPDYATVDDIADECFMPLTVGGGVRTLEHARQLLRLGADKIAVNTALVERPEIVREIANQFGTQCVVASIDVKRVQGKCEVYTHSGTRATGLEPVRHAKHMAELGAGEILITSIDRDGTMSGYDVALVRQIAAAVSIPVIASGGAGSYHHMAEVILEGGASAVAAASIFHFTQQTPLEAKTHLRSCGIHVRS